MKKPVKSGKSDKIRKIRKIRIIVCQLALAETEGSSQLPPASNIHPQLNDLLTSGMRCSTLTSAWGGGGADVRASSVHIPSYGDTWGFVMVRGTQTVVGGPGGGV